MMSLFSHMAAVLSKVAKDLVGAQLGVLLLVTYNI